MLADKDFSLGSLLDGSIGNRELLRKWIRRFRDSPPDKETFSKAITVALGHKQSNLPRVNSDSEKKTVERVQSFGALLARALPEVCSPAVVDALLDWIKAYNEAKRAVPRAGLPPDEPVHAEPPQCIYDR